MAKYRLTQPRFIGEHLYRPSETYSPVIEVPDDFPAGMGMEPLDAAAKARVAEWEKKMGGKPIPEPPVVVKEIMQHPVTDEAPTLKPLGSPVADAMTPVKPAITLASLTTPAPTLKPPQAKP